MNILLNLLILNNLNSRQILILIFEFCSFENVQIWNKSNDSEKFGLFFLFFIQLSKDTIHKTKPFFKFIITIFFCHRPTSNVFFFIFRSKSGLLFRCYYSNCIEFELKTYQNASIVIIQRSVHNVYN